nr:hypothetical protein BaRGS_013418 [Batillaria attramentaria]
MTLQVLLLLVWTSVASLTHAQTAATAHPHYRVVCYLDGWARHRQDPVTYVPEDLDTSLCTHVIYAFALLDKTGTQIVPAEPEDVNMELASSKHNMQTFATGAVEFLHKYNFDGLDIDWEYPGDRGSPAGDKHHFTQLLKDYTINFILNTTVPREKLNLGLAFYGITFNLAWRVVLDVGFLRVDYVMQHGLGGVMIWTISMDDFHGICGQGHYPLMHAIKDSFHAGLVG